MVVILLLGTVLVVFCSRDVSSQGSAGYGRPGGSMGGGGRGMAGGRGGGLGNGGMSRGGGMMRGGAGGMGNGGIANKGLPPGYANIRGEVMDMANKVIQRVTAAGTNYYSYENQNGVPVFKRREMDSGRRFVLFPDLNFPQGDGHYIVLRKMPGVNIPGVVPQPLYEAFQLSLGDSIHGYVSDFNSQDYLKNSNQRQGMSSNVLSTGFGGMGGGGGAGMRRMKRKPQTIEMSPLDLEINHPQEVVLGEEMLKRSTSQTKLDTLSAVESVNEA